MNEKFRPNYYGGKDNKFEAINLIRMYVMPFELANATKYILRAGNKHGEEVTKDLTKAVTYIKMYIKSSDTYHKSTQISYHFYNIRMQLVDMYNHLEVSKEWSKAYNLNDKLRGILCEILFACCGVGELNICVRLLENYIKEL